MADRAGVSVTARNNAILSQLHADSVKAILFVTIRNGGALQMKLIRQWGIEGHLIGNHTVHHPYFNSQKVSLEDYEKEVLGCDSAISKLYGYRKLFRFTYLKEGNTLDKRDQFRQFMKSIDYRSAPVSIDASDWFYDDWMVKRLTQTPDYDLQKLKTAYLNHLWNRSVFYDSLSQKYLGRSVKHILLLHHNQINAFFLKDIIAMYHSNGWMIIDPEEAFADPVYSIEPRSMPAGESILRQIAVDNGAQNLRYPGEDGEYEKPILEALGL